jgi:pimeloyl-ACP methyl ester carboxylesterase
VRAAAAAAAPVRTPALPSAFTTQTLRWQPCFTSLPPGVPRAASRMQCAAYKVPRTWSAPSVTAAVTIVVSRLPATRSPARGATFTNPGGPGVPGLLLPLSLLMSGKTGLLTSQDVYGMDVRGTGLSTNATCGNPAYTQYDPRVRTAANLKRILDQAARHAASCDTRGGAFIDTVTTFNTVRDMDLLRRLVKKTRINYIGYSAGSWLGAAYATTFPQQTGRFVLDSNLDVTGGWQKAFNLQPLGFERRFRTDFLPWAARNDAAYSLGTTAAGVKAFYEKLRADLARRPLEVEDDWVVNGPALDNLVASSLYSKSDFPALADDLAALRTLLDIRGSSAAGGRVAATLEAQLEESLEDVTVPAMGTVDAEEAAFLAITCNDTAWTGKGAPLITSSAAQGKLYPLLGWGTLDTPCPYWRRPAVPAVPMTGKGAPAMMLVQSERDPATPIEGARRTNAALAGSRMLVVTGEGDHALYASGNACVDKAVETFLANGVLPARGATCKGTPLPPPDTDPRETITGTASPVLRAAELSRRITVSKAVAQLS